MENFTPFSGFLGGILIGLAAIGLLKFNRQICGISGIAQGCIPPLVADSIWRCFFIAGLLCGGLILRYAYPVAFDFTLDHSAFYFALSGILVGFGTRLGKGCTSGHGICGIGRLAPRSLLATAIFFIVAILTRTIMIYYGI